MPRRLAVVILHYGSPKTTARLHEQLLAADPKWEELYVLDNAAPEPWPGAWRRLPENRYWAGALAFSAEHFAARGYSHLWFLNNDLVFETRAPIIERAWLRLARLEKRLGSVGVYSPAVLRNPYHPQMVADARRQFRLVRYVDGIAPLFRLDCLQRIGGVDRAGNEYGYGVDVALGLAAHAAGFPVVVDHQLVARHIYHTTARTVPGFMEAAARAEEAYMRRRLGPGWRDAVAEAAAEMRDFDEL